MTKKQYSLGEFMDHQGACDGWMTLIRRIQCGDLPNQKTKPAVYFSEVVAALNTMESPVFVAPGRQIENPRSEARGWMFEMITSANRWGLESVLADNLILQFHFHEVEAVAYPNETGDGFWLDSPIDLDSKLVRDFVKAWVYLEDLDPAEGKQEPHTIRDV